MTEEQIFELIEKHFQLAPIHDNTYLAWFGETNDFIKFAREICEKDDFYKTRCELLQKVQKYMRDPERQIVCDILANNSLLPDPSGKRYGQDLKKLIDL